MFPLLLWSRHSPVFFNITITLCQTVFEVPWDVYTVTILSQIRQAQPCISNIMFTLCHCIRYKCSNQQIYLLFHCIYLKRPTSKSIKDLYFQYYFSLCQTVYHCISLIMSTPDIRFKRLQSWTHFWWLGGQGGHTNGCFCCFNVFPQEAYTSKQDIFVFILWWKIKICLSSFS